MDHMAWRRISKALDFYTGKGFQFIDLPWHVPHDIAGITCPTEERMFHLREYGVLVGSAEQSFIAAQKSGALSEGRFVAVSPCFRNEGADRDNLHALYFMKVELYSTLSMRKGEDAELALIAKEFMLSERGIVFYPSIDLVETQEGFDLEIGGIEVGSYSSRRHEDMAWTCGTGLAEPRFSMALSTDTLPDWE